MGTASAGFFGNNYNGSNGFFGFNPYSFMEPRWFIKEARNFVDEFDNDNYYGNRSRRYSIIPYNYSNADSGKYYSSYMTGYSNYYK
jgi:hypothetical protein